MRRIFGTLAIFLFSLNSAQAAGDYRLSLGLGVANFDSPDKTAVFIGAEYEYRPSALLGVGGFVNYALSTPSITLIGLPTVFLHPLASDFYVSASPVVQFGDGIGTHYGARLGTQIPIPLGLVSLIPQAAVDFINGGRNYLFGLGIRF